MATQKSTSKATRQKQEAGFGLPKGLPKSVARLQKNLLERQHSAFETAYQAVASLQDGRDSAVQGFLEASPFVPAELRQVTDAWIEAAHARRETFKKAVDRSFELFGAYWERIAEEQPEPAAQV